MTEQYPLTVCLAAEGGVTSGQAANSSPFWALYDFKVTGDLAVSSPFLNTNAPSNAATRLSASATAWPASRAAGRLSERRLGAVDWRWDRLTLLGSAQATFRTTKTVVLDSCQPYQICLGVSSETVTEQVKKPITWVYRRPGSLQSDGQAQEAITAISVSPGGDPKLLHSQRLP